MRMQCERSTGCVCSRRLGRRGLVFATPTPCSWRDGNSMMAEETGLYSPGLSMRFVTCQYAKIHLTTNTRWSGQEHIAGNGGVDVR